MKAKFLYSVNTKPDPRQNLMIKMTLTQTFDEKIALLKKSFQEKETLDERYQLLISLGQTLEPFNQDWMTEENLVKGCQSILYIKALKRKNRIFFYVGSDALISKGLAAVLTSAYSGETNELIQTTPPTFLEDLKIQASLSPNRAMGMLQIFLKMKELSRSLSI